MMDACRFHRARGRCVLSAGVSVYIVVHVRVMPCLHIYV
jgi:hypothetical protein